jgi:hypothetical protein
MEMGIHCKNGRKNMGEPTKIQLKIYHLTKILAIGRKSKQIE